MCDMRDRSTKSTRCVGKNKSLNFLSDSLLLLTRPAGARPSGHFVPGKRSLIYTFQLSALSSRKFVFHSEKVREALNGDSDKKVTRDAGR